MQSTQWINTARLLRCGGFGTTGTDVDAALAAGGATPTTDKLVDAVFAEDTGVLATPLPNFDSTVPPDLPAETLALHSKRLEQQRRELSSWWLRRMMAVENPLAEKLTFLWHNHFATSIDGVRSAQLMAVQNQTIRDNCLGNFRVLAREMLTDGAMIRWLNGDSNAAKSPNENLAREFMELFALGHGGGYTEIDVREGARALTGWVLNSHDEVEFRPRRHDGTYKKILGVAGNHDTSAFCDIVLQQPSSAEFIVRRLWHQLASDNPPEAVTSETLLNAYGASCDLKALTKSILNSHQFKAERGSLVSSPVNWLVGLLRTLNVSIGDTKLISSFTADLKALGQLPFHPPSVGGWPRGKAWLSTSAAEMRFRAVAKAAKYGDISAVEEVPTSERLEAVAYQLGIGHWSDQTAKALAPVRSDPMMLVIAAANTPEYLTT